MYDVYLQMIKREGIPDTIQYGKLLKELQKAVKHFQVRTPIFLLETTVNYG